MYESSLKSAEVCPKVNYLESAVEVWYAKDMPVVYKIFMVRMLNVSDNNNWRILECTGLKKLIVEMQLTQEN